jgi:hypothetical protein
MPQTSGPAAPEAGLRDSTRAVAVSLYRVRFENPVYKPLREQKLQSEVYLASTHPNPSPLLRAFVETSQQVARLKFPGCVFHPSRQLRRTSGKSGLFAAYRLMPPTYNFQFY